MIKVPCKGTKSRSSWFGLSLSFFFTNRNFSNTTLCDCRFWTQLTAIPYLSENVVAVDKRVYENIHTGHKPPVSPHKPILTNKVKSLHLAKKIIFHLNIIFLVFLPLYRYQTRHFYGSVSRLDYGIKNRC